MPWHSKENPTPLDSAEIPGLEFLNGDAVAQRYQQRWLEGKKYPLISFPSGVKREIQSSKTHPSGAVHIFDNFEVGYYGYPDEAYEAALELAQQHGYRVSVSSPQSLTIFNPYSSRSYELVFDSHQGILADIVLRPEHAMELLGGESRALLPPLYANERLGLAAIAPLKFFTPDANWTWYPTEFDGDDICFGLVAGFEVELGYFSLTELEGVRGGLSLPIERDLYYEPSELKELISLHERRG